MAMKKCKECGTEISSSAKVCPNCGKKQKHTGLIVIIVIILLIIIIACAGGSSNESEETSTSSSTASDNNTTETIEYTAVNIDELEDALDNNAAAAKEKYNGQYLEITGRLGTIDSDLAYISLLSTTDDWDIVGVHCTVKNEEQKTIIKTLSSGDTIVVKGKITNVGETLGYYLDITEISSK